jgi:hypothetical protein
MMFLDCPAYLDRDSAARCGLPAEVRCRFTMRSADGPIECAMIRCPAGHWFNGAIESLTWDGKDTHHPRPAAGPPSGRPRTPQRTQDSHDEGSKPGTRDFPSRKWREVSRPITAPAYYLGRPAALLITAMRPRSLTAANRPMGAVAPAGHQRYPGAVARQPAADAAGRVPDPRLSGTEHPIQPGQPASAA